MATVNQNAINQVLNGLQTPIQPVERSQQYSNGLFAAAFIMVFMVMVYMGMLVTSFWLLLNILFLIGYTFASGSISASICYTIIFGFMFLVGFSVFLALLRPLISQPKKMYREVVLDPGREPVLFEFVNRVCRAVGSDVPSQIVVDPNVNAGASFMNGIFDRRLRLLIGLPLVLGLDTRQFAGVLAHEFGHFSQTSGMRLTYLVRSIDMWFVDAVYQRNAWDQKLKDYSGSSNIAVTMFFAIVRLVVWFARMILLGLVYVSHFFSSRLLQEMEFDADRHEARLSGSQNFAKTSHRMRILQLCQDKTLYDLDHYRRTRRLPDNFPALLVDNEQILDKSKLKELEEDLLEVETKWHDSHPSDRDRVENAALENAMGTFTVEHPASVLFSDITGLCKVVTMQTYRRVFEKDFDPSRVKDTDDLIALRDVSRTEGKAALRFILDQFCSYDSFVLQRYQLGQPRTVEQYKIATEQRRGELIKNVRSYYTVCQQEEQVEDDLAATTVSIRLLEAGFQIARAKEKLPVKTLQAGHQKKKQLTTQDQSVKHRLQPFRQMLGNRILESLDFLRSPQVVASIKESPAVVQEVENILRVWGTIIELRPTFDSFLFEAQVNSLLLQIAPHFKSQRMGKSVNAALTRLSNGMIRIQQSTVHVMYPFEHGLGQVSVSHYLLPELPDKNDIFASMDAAVDLKRNLDFLLRRCIARIGALAEKVETVFGFPPLETPPEVKQNK